MRDHALPEPAAGLPPSPPVEDESRVLLGRYLLSVGRSDWDSGHLGRDVLKVSSLVEGGDPGGAIPWEEWRVGLPAGALVWVRLSALSGAAVRGLEAAGFRYVSGLSTFRWRVGELELPASGYSLRQASGEDARDIGALGGQAFVLDRLFLDPEVPEGAAVRMYGEWSANCARGLCDSVLLAVREGSPAGFVSTAPDGLLGGVDGNGDCRRIILIAVHPGHRRRGLGRLLVAGAMRECLERGADTLLVGTSSVNVPAQALYTAMGFSPYYSEVFMELVR